MIKIVIPIEGMHCRACEITIGQHLQKVPRVLNANVSLKSKSATIEATSPPSQHEIEKAVRAAGYEVGTRKKPLFSRNTADYKDFIIGVVVIGIIAMLYVYFDLDKSLSTGNMSSGGLSVALITGIVAGLSTCMALVGGLVLGLSARHAIKHPSATPLEKFRPHLFFNVSRIVSFFVLGGAIGLLGSSFQLQGASLGIITMLVGIIMLTMGVQLTNLMPRISSGRLALPSGIAKFIGLKKHQEKEYSHTNAIALGALSFFLPCGFTQVMQLYAISTGSFMTGALVMGIFAIGTAPGLLGIGGLTSVIKGKASSRLFKVAGVAVIAMAFINISNGFNLTGYQLPTISAPSSTPAVVDSSQTLLRTTFTRSNDIVPRSFTVSKGVSYTLEVDSKDEGQGCMSTIMIPGLFNEPLLLKKGQKQILTFTAERPGTYQITCAMGIPRGTIRVV